MNSIAIDGREYLSMEEASKRSGYHIRTINRLARTGKIDAEPMGSTWVIAVDFKEKYMAERPQRKPYTEQANRKPRKGGTR